tara:strand:- start:15565 stop:15723 length:159 start_codon:yes stop_codon:yes gene_type:complete
LSSTSYFFYKLIGINIKEVETSNLKTEIRYLILGELEDESQIRVEDFIEDSF